MEWGGTPGKALVNLVLDKVGLERPMKVAKGIMSTGG